MIKRMILEILEMATLQWMIEMERNIIGVKEMIEIRENDGINRGRNRKNTLQ